MASGEGMGLPEVEIRKHSGLVGLFQENRKKVFAVLGLIFNAFTGFGVLLLVVIGMIAG